MDNPDLYYEIFSCAKLNGENIGDLAKRHKVTHQNIRKACFGKWNGKKSRALLLAICRELYIRPPSECLPPKEEDGSQKTGAV